MSPRAQSGRQISETKLAPFPWCSFKEGPAHSPLWAGRSWGIVPSTLSLVHTWVQRGISVTAHYCPPRATLQDPVPGVSAMVCVPKSLCEPPARSALQHSSHRLFTYKHPAVFKVQLSQAHSQDTWDTGPRSCCQDLLLPFCCFMPLSPCKAGGIYSIFIQTPEFMGQNYYIRAGHQWNGVSAASRLQRSHLVNSRKLNTLQKLSIPRSLPNTHKEFGTTETIISLHIRGMLFVSKGFIY